MDATQPGPKSKVNFKSLSDNSAAHPKLIIRLNEDGSLAPDMDSTPPPADQEFDSAADLDGCVKGLLKIGNLSLGMKIGMCMESNLPNVMKSLISEVDDIEMLRHVIPKDVSALSKDHLLKIVEKFVEIADAAGPWKGNRKGKRYEMEDGRIVLV